MSSPIRDLVEAVNDFLASTPYSTELAGLTPEQQKENEEDRWAVMAALDALEKGIRPEEEP